MGPVRQTQKKIRAVLTLLAVIALLALIIAGVLFGVRKSRDVHRVANIKEVQTALELYANENHGRYPPQTSQGGLPTVLVPALMQVLPVDPQGGGRVYQYITNDTATSYCVGAKLEGAVPTPASTCLTVILSGAVNYSLGN